MRKKIPFDLIAAFWIIFILSWTCFLHFSKEQGNLFPGWDEFKFLIKSEYIKENGFFAIFDAYKTLPDFVVVTDIVPTKPPVAPLYYAFLRLFGFSPKSFFWRFFNIFPSFLCFFLYYFFVSKYFGKKVALFSTFLFSTTPITIAQSQVIHSDNLAVVLTLIGSIFCFYLWKERKQGIKMLVVSGVVFSTWALVKYNALVFIAIFFFLFILPKIFEFDQGFLVVDKEGVKLLIPFVICFSIFLAWVVFAYENTQFALTEKSSLVENVVGLGTKPFSGPPIFKVLKDVLSLSLGVFQFFFVFFALAYSVWKRNHVVFRLVFGFVLLLVFIWLAQYPNRFFLPSFGLLFVGQSLAFFDFLKSFGSDRKVLFGFVVLGVISLGWFFKISRETVNHNWVLPSGYYFVASELAQHADVFKAVMVQDLPDIFYYYVSDKTSIFSYHEMVDVNNIGGVRDFLVSHNITHVITDPHLCGENPPVTKPCFFIKHFVQEGSAKHKGIVGFLYIYDLFL